MRYPTVRLSLAVVALVVLSAGCMTASHSGRISMVPVVPDVDEQVTLDNLLVLVDVTGSMTGGKFRREQSLIDAFAEAMPDGTYEAGISSFSGVESTEWVMCPVAPYDRAGFNDCESRVVLLGSLTPLDQAIRMLTPQMTNKGGNGALLVFSDGKAQDEAAVFEACREMQAAHGGKLCIYTVRIGNSVRGKDILDEMAALSGCGHAWNACELDSSAAIEQMVRTIFFGAASMAGRREIVLPGNVLFDLDKAVLKPRGKAEVDRVVALLKANPRDTVLIEGHTCDLASEAYNLDLSQRRADAVRNYAISQGIDAARMSTRAYGESQPAVPNTSAANRKLNRRVTIVW